MVHLHLRPNPATPFPSSLPVSSAFWPCGDGRRSPFPHRSSLGTVSLLCSPGSELVLIVVSQLVALFTEALVFGAFTVLYAIAIWILLYREKKRNQSSLNKRLFVTSTIMWLLAVTVCPVTFSSYSGVILTPHST